MKEYKLIIQKIHATDVHSIVSLQAGYTTEATLAFAFGVAHGTMLAINRQKTWTIDL
jgi:hypothetical protein